MVHPDQSLLVEAAKKVWEGSNDRLNVSIPISKKLANVLYPFFGVKPESAFITDSDIRHIKRKHGRLEEARGQQAIMPDDFARIPEVLNDFDSCEHTDTDKLGNNNFSCRNVCTVMYI